MKLTKEQSAILGEVLKGHTNDRIAMDLGYSPNTVKKRLKEIYRVCLVSNRAELFLRMLNGTLSLDEILA